MNNKYWFDNCPVKTLHANTITSSIPYGERFFVACIAMHLKKIKVKSLKRQAIQFIREELRHSKAHYRLYLQVVKPHYPNLKIKKRFYQNFFAFIAILVGNKTRLAIVAGMEHFTAIAGEYYLAKPQRLQGMSDPIKDLWLWHFQEEIAHKSVALDIFNSTGINYVIRIFGYFLAGLFLVCGFIGTFCHMAINDKLIFSIKFHHSLFQFFFSKDGIVRALWFPFLSYLKPFFHPKSNH